MRQLGTAFVILFVLISLGIVAFGALERNQPQPTPTQIELTLAVTPLAQNWMAEMVRAFNASDARGMGDATIRIILDTATPDDIHLWHNNRISWNDLTRPDMWLASSSLSVAYIGNPFHTEVMSSIAKTPMIWVVDALVAQTITENDTLSLDWDAVQAAAQAETWRNFGATNLQGNVTLAFSLPDNTTHGLMVLASAYAYRLQSLTIGSRDDFASVWEWLAPVVQAVPNFATIGADVATFMVSRGQSVNIAMMPEAQFLNQVDAFLRGRPVRVAYPEYPVLLDFPLATWDKAYTMDAMGQTIYLREEEKQTRQMAIEAFTAWLLAPEQQALLPAYGVRPATFPVSDADELFRKGIAVGIEYAPQLDPYLTAFARSNVTALFSWFVGQRQR